MINLYHLKYFYDAAHSGSLLEAARKNFISHSAVSQAIRALEKSLNAELIHHEKGNFELTDGGRKLLAGSEDVLNAVESLRNSLHDNQFLGPLRIGASQSIFSHLIATSFNTFIGQHPQVKPELWVGNADDLRDELRIRKIDIGIGIDDGSFDGFVKKTILKGKFCLVKNTKLKQTSSRYLIGDKGEEVTKFLKHVKQFKTYDLMRIQSWNLAFEMMKAGMGVALIPDFMIKGSLLQKVHEELTLPSYEVCTFYRTEKTLGAKEKAFIQYLISKIH